MIIVSHIRGDHASAARYLSSRGKNEKTRIIEISDYDASTLTEAFYNMWAVACHSQIKKMLHHISINPCKDERLSDQDVSKIVRRCENKYGYQPQDHQRVIVEHIKKERQTFPCDVESHQFVDRAFC